MGKSLKNLYRHLPVVVALALVLVTPVAAFAAPSSSPGPASSATTTVSPAAPAGVSPRFQKEFDSKRAELEAFKTELDELAERTDFAGARRYDWKLRQGAPLGVTNPKAPTLPN